MVLPKNAADKLDGEKDNIKKWTRASLEENIIVTEEVVQLERPTSELTPPTKVSKYVQLNNMMINKVSNAR